MLSVGKMWDKGNRKFLLVDGKAYNVYKNDYKVRKKDADWNIVPVKEKTR